jgi:hypothetical protein
MTSRSALTTSHVLTIEAVAARVSLALIAYRGIDAQTVAASP